MKKTLLAAVFGIFVLVNSGQAKMISVYDFTGSFDATRIGTLQQSYEVTANRDRLWSIGVFPINALAQIPVSGDGPWREMLQRTYTQAPPPNDITDEFWFYYKDDIMHGYIDIGGTTDYIRAFYSISPIPDLSAYSVNALYFDSFFNQIGTIVDYDIRLLADVSPAPVPEPSTFILLAIGVGGIWFMRRRNKILT